MYHFLIQELGGNWLKRKNHIRYLQLISVKIYEPSENDRSVIRRETLKMHMQSTLVWKQLLTAQTFVFAFLFIYVYAHLIIYSH